jgi:hypothetical protein
MTIPSTVKTFLFLTASASALGVLIHFESPRANAAVTAAPAPPPPPASQSPTAPAPSRTVAAPDLVGKRLSVARRAARKLGLVVIAHDGDGLRVDGEQGAYYRVRRQSTPAGARVEPGAAVEVRVREIEPPSGY